jgi:lysylphosphatidylglycerol synthetase-like protein (DUF2156 family)
MSQAAAAPQGRSVASRIASTLLVVVGGLVWLLVAAILVFVVPKFHHVFKEFDVALPPLTQLLLSAGQTIANYAYAFALVWFGVVAGLAIWSGLAGSRRAWWLAGIFAIIAIIATSVLVPLMVIGLFQPLVQLIQSVGARP